MKTYYSINYRAKKPCVLALGCFDGVHIGHKKVIETAVNFARELDYRCTVWTFEKPPKNFFSKNAAPLLTSQKQKQSIIASLGADVLVTVPFDSDIANMTAEDFFTEIIVNKLRASHVVCGFDYSFGAKGIGNTVLLKKLCQDHDIGLTVVPELRAEGTTVSSTVIRDVLLSGDVKKAALLLGRPYSIVSTVISGQHLATKLGFPTLNQAISSELATPKNGVYASRITICGKRKGYFGITNVGVRPTVGGTSLFAETHIFDFSEDIYGKKVKIEFLDFLREEKKFDSISALAEQVEKDIARVKKEFH